MASQNQRVLKHLKTGRPLTSLQALNKFGIMRLAARINDLKDSGHNIMSMPVKLKGKRFAQYRLAS